ncbi:MAG TPA: alpha/beta fold hydrolase [Longimicrobiales bacterium]|nr:alpha/beta fold hydrolase [Longimicrobiales bacterium]
MIASEKSGRGAEKHLGRSAFLDEKLTEAMERLMVLGGTPRPALFTRVTSVHGRRVHYLEAGEGETMLLLHGAGGGAANWYRLFPALAQHYHVIAIDLPGFGLSESLAPEAPLGIQVARYLDEALVKSVAWGGAQHIIGTSFGGLTAFRLAQIQPPKSLILIDAAGLWPEAAWGLRFACNRLIQSIPLKQSRAGTLWLLRNVLLANRIDPEHEAALADYIYWSNVRTDRRMLARAYTQFAGLRGQSEVFTDAELRALAHKTLIVWGERDWFLPAREARRSAALAAGATLRIIPNVGHSPNWEAPDILLREILDFVKRDEQEEPARSSRRADQ